MSSHSSVVRSAGIASLAVLIALCWQAVVVQTTYKGNWTGLFCAGDHFTRPPEIQDREYLFRGSTGYDGQFYQLIAHDPFLRHGYDRFIDAPRLRYRRILMPGLAYLFAAGQSDYIDASYIAVCLLFVGLGTFSLAQLAANAGRSPWWGLLFFVAPSTLIGLDRMTVDIALSALAIAALLAALQQRWLLLWLALAGAALSKETGVLPIAGVVFWLAMQRKFRLAAALSSSVLPALAWYAFIHSHTQGEHAAFDISLIAPFFAILKLPLDPGIVALVFRIAAVAAVIGIVWAAIRSVVLAVQSRFRDLAILLSLSFAILVFVLQNHLFWEDPDGFTRLNSQLLLCLVAATWKRGFAQSLVQFAMVAAPMCLQFAAHLVWPLAGMSSGR